MPPKQMKKIKLKGGGRKGFYTNTCKQTKRGGKTLQEQISKRKGNENERK